MFLIVDHKSKSLVATESIHRAISAEGQDTTTVILLSKTGRVRVEGIGKNIVDKGPTKDIPSVHQFILMDGDEKVKKFFFTVE